MLVFVSMTKTRMSCFLLRLQHWKKYFESPYCYIIYYIWIFNENSMNFIFRLSIRVYFLYALFPEMRVVIQRVFLSANSSTSHLYRTYSKLGRCCLFVISCSYFSIRFSFSYSLVGFLIFRCFFHAS